MIYQTLFKYLISKTDPEDAHHRAIHLAQWWGRCPFRLALLRATLGRGVGDSTTSWVGDARGYKVLPRRLPGKLGLAGGMDKDGQAILSLAALGFAFIEVGTVTARPQPGNPRPRLWRLLETAEIRNQMGFNNLGAAALAQQLKKLRMSPAGRAVVVGVNIGKTKITPLSEAVQDYIYSASQVAPWCDYLVVNVSSPNTPGLRKLQDTRYLEPILKAVSRAADKAARRHVPLLVKIAPDLNDRQVDEVAQLVSDLSLDGVVATNTTIKHPYGSGGVSGPRLRPRALQVVAQLRQKLGPKPLIIGVGGISSAADAKAFLEAGADLLQGFTALIYHGPTWPGQINRDLAKSV